MGGSVLSKSLIQLSVGGWCCAPSQLFNLRPNYGGGDEDNGGLLQKVPCMHCSVPLTLQQATADPRLCQRLLDNSQVSLGQSLVGSLLLSPESWCTQGLVCALQESVSPVLCKSGGSMWD